MFEIGILYPPEESRMVTFRRKQLVIGRSSSSCDLVIKNDSVSRIHCLLKWRPNGFRVEDLGSTHGVTHFWNETKHKELQLTSGEKIQLGTCILRIDSLHTEPNPGISLTRELIEQARNSETTQQDLEKLAALSPDLRRLIASRIDAPSSLLKKLAESYDVKILQNLVQNPNTPTEELLILGEYFPELLQANPAYPLLFLEDSTLVKKL